MDDGKSKGGEGVEDDDDRHDDCGGADEGDQPALTIGWY